MKSAPAGRAWWAFQVRFTDQSKGQHADQLMDRRYSVAETQHDRLLQRYDTLIIAEAHERSLNTISARFI